MKMILMGLLFLSAVPIFAQDSLAYKDLPDCFFKVDTTVVGKISELEDIRHVIVAIDTCECIESLKIANWPLPVNGFQSLHMATIKMDSLLQYNKIF